MQRYLFWVLACPASHFVETRLLQIHSFPTFTISFWGILTAAFRRAGRAKPSEAFSFECEVTAHQTAAASSTAMVLVAADIFTYKSGTLLFHQGDVELPRLTGSGWSKFEMACAPEITWLSINSGNGQLTYTGQTSSQGFWGCCGPQRLGKASNQPYIHCIPLQTCPTSPQFYHVL